MVQEFVLVFFFRRAYLSIYLTIPISSFSTSYEQVSDIDYRLIDLLYGQLFVIVFYVE